MAGKPWQAGQLDILVKASAHSSFAWILSTRESTFFPSLSACENVLVATKLLRKDKIRYISDFKKAKQETGKKDEGVSVQCAMKQILVLPSQL